MKIAYFQRNPHQAHFSIERVFEGIRKYLPKDAAYNVIVARFPSQGFFKRLYITFAAIGRQAEVNHVTGDIHFVSFFLRKRRTILTIHDCGFMKHPNPLARFVLSWFWLKLPVKSVRYVTVISEATRQEVIHHSKCSPDKVVVIPNYVSSVFTYSPKEFDNKTPRLLQIGTKFNKNIPRLATALKNIPCQLMIVGKPRKEDLRALNENMINFVWKTNLSESELLQAYQQSDMLTFVSTLEGFGLPIVEAQALGRVVLTSNVSAMPEVAGNGACLVDPFDISSIRRGVLHILKDPDYRAYLISEGLRNVERFRPESVVNQYYELYQKVLNEA